MCLVCLGVAWDAIGCVRHFIRICSENQISRPIKTDQDVFQFQAKAPQCESREVDGQRHLDAKAAAAGAALQLQPRRAHEAAHTAHLAMPGEPQRALNTQILRDACAQPAAQSPGDD